MCNSSVPALRKALKKPLALLTAVALVLSMLPMYTAPAFAAPAPAETPAGASDLLIAMVYGGGGSEAGSPADGVASTHSFVEIYNPTNTAISLDGYALHYQGYPTQEAARRTGDTWAKLELDATKTIPARHSFLINCGATLDGTTLKLTDADFDQVWVDAPVFVTKGAKYVLTHNMTGTIPASTVNPFTANAGAPLEGYVDMFGCAGNDAGKTDQIDGFETEFLGGKTNGSSKKKGFVRIDRNIDTNNNAKDFKVIALDAPESEKPRNLAAGALGGSGETLAPPVSEQPATRPTLDAKSEKGYLTYLGSYWTGMTNADGGVAEIVKYNSDNKKMYLVSGQFQALDIVSLAGVEAGKKAELSLEKRVFIKDLGEAHGFPYGDITSVDVNTKKGVIAIATQAVAHDAPGSVVLLDYEGNYLAHYLVGIQPDALTFTPDGNAAITSNEGEPRLGYEGAVDPQGSVSIIDLTNFNTTGGKDKGTVKTVDFTGFDSQREQLIKDCVLLKPNTAPSVDLEPEYVAVAADSKIAYVSLQEANAVATLDLVEGTWLSIRGLGFKDHNLKGNELDLRKDDAISIQNENAYGVYMPDGLATTNIGGVQYVLTPNEGDSREWGTYTDTGSARFGGKKVDILLNAERDGLDADKTYLYGARSFSIWNAADMTQVYDSGSDFETKIAELFPAAFNSSHNSLEVDKRSPKKGPEPEDIKTLTTADGTFAFVGLERVGGVMMYDISNPAEARYYDYLNVRDVSSGNMDNGSDLGAEGLCVIEAKDSPTKTPLVLAANEVSGSVTLMQVDTSGATSKPIDNNPGGTPGGTENPGSDNPGDNKPGDTENPGGNPGDNKPGGTENPGSDNPGDDNKPSTPVEYPVTSPAPEWNGSGTATVTIDAPLEKFVRLLLNGSEVDRNNYTLQSGSTIITFKESYLKTLGAGTHVFRAEFTDGVAQVSLKTKAPAAPSANNTLPVTGDGITLLIPILIAVVLLGAALAVIGISLRKRNAAKCAAAALARRPRHARH